VALPLGSEALHERLDSQWISECLQGGNYILSLQQNVVSTDHNKEDMQKTCGVQEVAFKAIRRKFNQHFKKEPELGWVLSSY